MIYNITNSLKDFKNNIQLEVKSINEDLDKLMDKIKYIFTKALYISVYSYQPKWYFPTYQLKKAIDIEYDGDSKKIIVGINLDKIDFYYSSISGNKMNEFVPYFIEVGHKLRKSANYPDNQWTNYHARKYLELAQQMIKFELDIDSKIININPFTGKNKS